MKNKILPLILSICICFSLIICALDFFSPATTPDTVTDRSNSPKNSIANISEDTHKKYTPLNYRDVRAVWISQFDMHSVYTENGQQRPLSDYNEKVSKIISNLSSIGVNTVFFQLRPNGDSLYPSELFPTSKYVSGAYGKECRYDAFEIFLNEAHNAHISVHAWINPLRCMKKDEISLISDSYAIKSWYIHSQPYLKEVDGYLYLNPAYREVIRLISNGVAEIIAHYDVDGIHIDDYFYPTTAESFDVEAYADYLQKGGVLKLGDFRRESINELVRNLYDTVKREDASLPFGISPSGNSQRNYDTLYADVELWCSSDCYIDYLCPQIYFGFEHETHPFDKILEEFSAMAKKGKIKLIVGLTLAKSYDGFNGAVDVWAGTGAYEWIESRDVIKQSIEYAKSQDVDGVAIFSYRFLFDPISGTPIPETADECALFIPLFKAKRTSN